MSAKMITLAFLVFFTAIAGRAQIANTKWTASLQLQQQVTVLFDFKKDTLRAITVADSTVIETMTYAVQDTAIQFKKISGQSECDSMVIGMYRFKIRANQLSLSLISDNCNDRSSVLDHTVWTKMD
jgi:hypothetical protein